MAEAPVLRDIFCSAVNGLAALTTTDTILCSSPPAARLDMDVPLIVLAGGGCFGTDVGNGNSPPATMFVTLYAGVIPVFLTNNSSRGASVSIFVTSPLTLYADAPTGKT